jgi:hypothetical protein
MRTHKRMRLALVDALHFRGMQAVDLPAALMSLSEVKNPQWNLQGNEPHRPGSDRIEIQYRLSIPINAMVIVHRRHHLLLAVAHCIIPAPVDSPQKGRRTVF